MRLLLTALAPLAWGSTYAVTTQLLPADRPLLAGLLRALPAGLLLLLLTRKLPSGSWWGKAFVLGVLNIGAFFPLLFLAAYRLPGGVAAVLGSVQPLIVIGLSAVLLGQRPVVRAVAAGMVGVLGVALVVLRPGASFDAVGLAAGLVGAAAMAAGTVLSKRWGRPDGVNALTTTAWQLTAGGLVIFPLALLIEGAPPALSLTNIAGYAYLATVNTAVAYWLWFRGLASLPASSAGFLGLLSPVAAMIIGWAALGQALTPVQVVGAIVALGATVAGALLAARSAPARSAPARSAPARSAPARSAPARSAPARSAPARSAPARPAALPAPGVGAGSGIRVESWTKIRPRTLIRR